LFSSLEVFIGVQNTTSKSVYIRDMLLASSNAILNYTGKLTSVYALENENSKD